MKFDHMTLPVSDLSRSRDWYMKILGFKFEFENLAAGFAAIPGRQRFQPSSSRKRPRPSPAKNVR